MDLYATTGVSPGTDITESMIQASGSVGTSLFCLESNKFQQVIKKIQFTSHNHYHIHSSTPLFENLIWMNTQEAADYLRITVNSLRIKVSRGEVKPCRLGKSLRFKRNELDKLMEASN